MKLLYYWHRYYIHIVVNSIASTSYFHKQQMRVLIPFIPFQQLSLLQVVIKIHYIVHMLESEIQYCIILLKYEIESQNSTTVIVLSCKTISIVFYCQCDDDHQLPLNRSSTFWVCTLQLLWHPCLFSSGFIFLYFLAIVFVNGNNLTNILVFMLKSHSHQQISLQKPGCSEPAIVLGVWVFQEPMIKGSVCVQQQHQISNQIHGLKPIQVILATEPSPSYSKN